MNVFHGAEQYRASKPCVVSVGNFDGVHRGHAELVGEVVRRARERELTSVVITFEPHTRKATEAQAPTRLLTTFGEKAKLLELQGVDNLICLPFDESLRRMEPEEFVKQILITRLRAKEWVMGPDHRFGRNRRGAGNSLRGGASRNDISTFAVRPSHLGREAISSTRIRSLIGKGKMAQAVEMLGHPYLIAATHVSGTRTGSRLGFPTLNFSIPGKEKVVPPAGIYAAHAQWGATNEPGALYFGSCPTFEVRDVHFEFYSLARTGAGPVAGETAFLWVHRHIREDRPFGTEEALVAQIKKDINRIREFFTQEQRYATF
jgi:riboflavin kinase/FMN adenylyltransferase